MPQNGKLDKQELVNYFKRVRKANKALKYYAVGEYGTKGKRPHYHAIVFNTPNELLVQKWTEPDNNTQTKGFVSTDTVTEASIHYVTGYIVEKYGDLDKRTGTTTGHRTRKVNQFSPPTIEDIRPFALMSKGLGKIYLKHSEKVIKSQLLNTVKKEGGINQLLPRYYKDKIFDDHEKELVNLKNQIITKYQDNDLEGQRQRRKYNKLKVENQLKSKRL